MNFRCVSFANKTAESHADNDDGETLATQPRTDRSHVLMSVLALIDVTSAKESRRRLSSPSVASFSLEERPPRRTAWRRRFSLPSDPLDDGSDGGPPPPPHSLAPP